MLLFSSGVVVNYFLNKQFTGKEKDDETGLYYFGARYLNPQTSMWLSADPAMGEYVPGAPVDDDARKRNGNLPGMGGVFNVVNLHAYHYAGNNPVKYLDPNGNQSGPNIYFDYNGWYLDQLKGNIMGAISAVGDFFAQAGNFLFNTITFNANFSFYREGSINIAGVAATVTLKDNEIEISTSVNSVSNYLEALQEASGSPVVIGDGKVSVSAKIGKVEIVKNKDDTATVKIGIEGKFKGLFASGVGLSITASTQDGPLGTLQNGGGAVGEAARKAEYLMSSKNAVDHLGQQ
jgi:RHS repeat-associated protein